MADDIRLVIGVEQSGLLKAITNTESLEAKVKKLSAAYARDAASYGRYNKAIGDLAKATNRNKKELLDYGKALRADEKATKKATAEVKAFTLARKQATEEDRRRTSEKKIAVKATEDLARAEAKNAASLKSMRMATDAVYRNQQKRLQMKKLLKAAVVAETMTTEQAIVALKKYNAAQASSNKVMGMAKNRMNGNNMAIQQLGYQFGDFAVQVQGGTSAFVAFSQQGAQLAGILPMVAGPLGLSMGAAVGLSAALGILIPIGSAVGRMFFEMKDATEKAEDALGNTVTALDDYRRSVEFGKKSTEELNVEFGKSATQLKNMQGLLQSVAVSRALDGLTTGSSMFGKDLDDAVSHINNIQAAMDKVKVPTAEQTGIIGEEAALIAEEAIQGFKDQMVDAAGVLGLLPEQAIELQKALKDINKSKDMEGMRDSSLAALEVIKGLGFAFGDIPIPIAEAVENLENLAGSASRATHEVDKITDAQERVRAAEKLAEQERMLGEQMLALERANALAQFHKDVEAESKTLDAMFANRTLSYSIRFVGEETVMSQGFGGPSQTKMSYDELKSSGLSDDLIKGMGVNMPKPKKTGGGGGGGGAKESPQEKLAKYLQGKQQELELEKQLVGVFGAERDIKSELFEVEQKYGKLIDTTQGSQLAGTLRQIEAEKERHEALEEAQAQQQTMADTLQSSMSDAFMSMVDGTKSFKDSMKDMARSVIKQLYDILVVQRLVGSFDSKTGGSGLVGMIMGAFQANGGAWQGGSQIKAYADGGVVGGPTTFPMAGGKTGLMGEAGPEAIMPLKRGANGKLGVQMEGGSQGNVVINQSFNFQANGDDSVKKIIAQAAPQIAQMTKSSLLNDRRRGGATKAAFG